MLGLNGFISSTNTILSGTLGLSDKFSNTFFYNLRGSYFFKDRLNLGMFAGISRINSEELIIRETETFIIGPQSRYYVSKNKEGSLYFELSAFYSRIYDRSAIIDIANSYDLILEGNGFGGSIGLGYTYVINDLVFLEIGFETFITWFNGDTIDQITNSKKQQNFTRYELSFNFGLGILLGAGMKK